jgi:hypothetical protein
MNQDSKKDEQGFLGLPIVNKALNLNAIKKASSNVVTAQKKKFETTLELSKMVLEAHAWFTSAQGQALASEYGVKWTTEQFGLQVFGWQKSYFYKLCRVAKLPNTIVEEFTAKCDQLEADNKEPQRSVESLLKFAKAKEEEPADGNGDPEDGDSEGTEVAEKESVLLTLSYKKEGGNVAFRIMSNGTVKTTNSPEELLEAIALIQATIATETGE